ncbi:hypothetical protein QMZ92_03725 [Streptomyces sp. HNM0645]|uniref:hypothetical protein n=1 Tax=Streptomyces sp. HNM0645 TaxID=2782343 RepID=UPI0024B63878|nr:hypothetical protein [Streptomyces sp. HNM0645]MDI9883532.1 hypothetical protein [Streptomyces sp. HNM0645]
MSEPTDPTPTGRTITARQPDAGRRPVAVGVAPRGPAVAAAPGARSKPVANERAAGGTGGAARTGSSRRGPADPVKALMHRHRELCERAVDPLEIAAGLEAHGVTDRTAARFRHRDVFSLAEELYARVPRGEESGPPAGDEDAVARPAHLLSAMAPGAVAVLTAAGLRLTEDGARLGVGAAGAAGLAVALAWSLRRGPLRAPGRTAPVARLLVCWLVAYSLLGDGLLAGLVAGGPDGPWPPAPGPLVGLALAVAPAAWTARLFAARARRRLGASRALEEFAAGTRPLLLSGIALHTGCLIALLVLTSQVLPVALAPAVALGLLLFLARLLTVHGFPHAAAAGLGFACTGEALAPAAVLVGRLPGCDFLARPVVAAVHTWGAAAVPALVCGAAALGLLVHATAVLSRASAHTT